MKKTKLQETRAVFTDANYYLYRSREDFFEATHEKLTAQLRAAKDKHKEGYKIARFLVSAGYYSAKSPLRQVHVALIKKLYWHAKQADHRVTYHAHLRRVAPEFLHPEIENAKSK